MYNALYFIYMYVSGEIMASISRIFLHSFINLCKGLKRRCVVPTKGDSGEKQRVYRFR